MKPKPTWAYWSAPILLFLLFAQLTTSAVVKSPTFDEPFHASFSYVGVATGDWRLQENEEHPPLTYLLIGPMFQLLPNHPDPHQLAAWSAIPFDDLELIQELLQSFDCSLDVLFFLLRVVIMGLTLLLGATLFRWAAKRHGPTGGLLALFIYTFSPNILAHGRLVTTDLTFALCFFLAVYAFQNLVQQPSLRQLAVAGVAFGLALGSKGSALLLIPIFVLLALLRSSRLFAKASQHPKNEALYIGWLALTTLIALLVLWALYGFEVGAWAEGWPALPLPTYAKSLLTVYIHKGGHPAFLMGQISRDGWPYYFPVTLAVKTPLPILIVALAGAVYLMWQQRWWQAITVVLPPIIFLGAACCSSLNIGYRHILPIAPFLALSGAALAGLPWQCKPLTLFGGGLALWLIVSTISVHPNYLAYFNELARGPEGGHRYLTDSNLDWGQDLIQLEGYLQAHGIEKVYFSHFGHVNPTAYEIHYSPLPSSFSLGEPTGFAPFAPNPGIYAVSATNLSGQYLENPSAMDWFNHQTPIASIGHSINIYDVPPDTPHPLWLAQCITPTVPLDGTAITEGLGDINLRQIGFDCTTSWLYPGGGAEMGIYALHHTLLLDQNPSISSLLPCPLTPKDPFVARHLVGAHLIYEQRAFDRPLIFALYARDGDTLTTPLPDSTRAAPASTPPDGLANASSLSPPIPLEGPLTFLGADAKRDGVNLEVETWWQVTETPITRPLSIMAHLITSDGKAWSVADGLGVSPLLLATGDVFTQRHRFATPPTDVAVWLRTGVYWLDTMERWRVTDTHNSDALFVHWEKIDGF